jgi:hypothetical protein
MRESFDKQIKAFLFFVVLTCIFYLSILVFLFLVFGLRKAHV